jgi:hypothetical protein
VVVGDGLQAYKYRGAKFSVLERLSSVCSLRDGHVVFPARLSAILQDAPGVHQVFANVSQVCGRVLCLVVLDASGHFG